MWPWCACLYGKLSARDLLALNNAVDKPAPSPTPNTENPGSKPEPLPPAPSLNYTQAWNPVHAKNRKNQEQRQPPNTANESWKSGVSEIEFIFAHEVSREYPEAYAYVIRRICERAGVPVPDSLQPPPLNPPSDKKET